MRSYSADISSVAGAPGTRWPVTPMGSRLIRKAALWAEAPILAATARRSAISSVPTDSPRHLRLDRVQNGTASNGYQRVGRRILPSYHSKTWLRKWWVPRYTDPTVSGFAKSGVTSYLVWWGSDKEDAEHAPLFEFPRVRLLSADIA